MQPIIILHTNDIHARVIGLARIATYVETVRQENPDAVVLYFDAGDIEDTINQLSNLTKGVSMHRLLSAVGCDAATVGNAALVRYGPQILAEQAAVARYPLLLANMRMPDGQPLPGVLPSVIVQAGETRLGLIGVTSELGGMYSVFGVEMQPAPQVIREQAAALRSAGVDAVVLLSHMGLGIDRELAQELQQDVSIIIGAHSHNLLPEGERIGDVLVVQAGNFAEHVGRLELLWDGERLIVQRVSVIPVSESWLQSDAVLREADVIDQEVTRFLRGVVGELAEPLDFAVDRECGVGNLMADVLRERMAADVAVVTAGQAFTAPLPAGPLQRMTLWDACRSPANPGVVSLTGAQLLALVERGLDPVFASECPRALRGQARGVMHLSGAQVEDGHLFIGGEPVEPERVYRVAGSDWELGTYGGYADAAWHLQVSYDVPTILREALEDYLAAHRLVRVDMGRVNGALAPISAPGSSRGLGEG